MTKDEREVIHDYQLQEKIVNEEFKIWKKTVPLLYDTIRTNALDYPSLTFNWLPGYKYTDGSKSSIALQYLISTNTTEAAENYLKLGSVELPGTLAPDNSNQVESSINPANDYSNFKVLSKWKQTSEINKLKVSPKGDQVVSFNNNGTVHYYPVTDGSPSTLDVENAKLYKYHTSTGNALEWLSNDKFVSGGEDSEIALWEVATDAPTHIFKAHSGAINDLTSNQTHSHIFGSVSDNSFTHFYDIRDLESQNPIIKHENKSIQNCIAFHPQIDTLYATAGKDNVVNLFDLRNSSTPFRKFFGHTESVIGLKWDSHHDPNSLVSWGLDKRAILWDLASLKEDFSYPSADASENSRRKASKADPCLRFIHAGHTNRINDVDIHPTVKSIFASVGEDNLVEIWKPKTLVVQEEEEEDEVMEGAE